MMRTAAAAGAHVLTITSSFYYCCAKRLLTFIIHSHSTSLRFTLLYSPPHLISSLRITIRMSASSFPAKQKIFGLIPSKKKKKTTAAPARKQLSMFSSIEEDDDEDNDEDKGRGGDVHRANRELSRRAATCDMSLLNPPATSLPTDSESDSKGGGNISIYDYDGAYDDFKQEAVQKKSTMALLSGANKDTALVLYSSSNNITYYIKLKLYNIPQH